MVVVDVVVVGVGVVVVVVVVVVGGGGDGGGCGAVEHPKRSGHVFLAFSLGNVLCATRACTLLLPHLNFQNCSGAEVFCAV